jgi:streptogramin lyase
MIVKWLAKVRSPGTELGQLRVYPRPRGSATRVVVTEYELPRVLISPHDVSGDSKGNIWYSSHRTPYMGVLDPRTGIVIEHQVPPTPPGVLPGTHRMTVDAHDIVWMSENWAHTVVRFDPASDTFIKIPIPGQEPVNTPGVGNFSIGPDGGIWFARNKAVQKFDSKTGQLLAACSLHHQCYQSLRQHHTDDGNFWAGGAAAQAGDTIELMDTRTGKLLELHSPPVA